MRIKYPTVDEVVAIHDSIVISTGGFSGILSAGNLDFVIAKLKIPRRFERKVAVLLFGIIADHPFVDGNKRTAFVVSHTFWEENGYGFRVSEEDIWKELHKISLGEICIDEVSKWLKENLVRR